MNRRFVLLLPLLIACCGDNERPVPARAHFPPLRYSYLPPINLNVQRVEMDEGFFPSTASGEIVAQSPVDPVDTLFAMARDRLKPMATSGTARFGIRTVSIVRRGNAISGELAVRLDVRDAEGTNSGYAEARATAEHTGPVPDQRSVIYDMMKSMMDQMNVELEFQIRNKLRSWVAEPPAATPPARQPVEPNLPPPPPAPPM